MIPENAFEEALTEARIPSECDSGREIQFVRSVQRGCVIRLAGQLVCELWRRIRSGYSVYPVLLADLQQLAEIRVEEAGLQPIHLIRHRSVLITHPGCQREVAPHLPGVLHISGIEVGSVIAPVRLLARGHHLAVPGVGNCALHVVDDSQRPNEEVVPVSRGNSVRILQDIRWA